MAMAHGYYRIAGKPAAVMVHVTVGTANALGGLMNAARDNVPVLLAAGRTPITETGQQASRNRPIHWGQESFDQGGMVREFVKWDYELRAGQPVEAVVDRALDIAMSEPRGPVYLTLPREVLASGGGGAAAKHGAAARHARPAARARRHRASRRVDRQGRVSPHCDFERGSRARSGERACGAGRGICAAGGASRAARHEPAERPPHASRPRSGLSPAEGRCGDRHRQRCAVDAAQSPTAQRCKGHPHLVRSAGDALSLPRDRKRSSDPGSSLVALTMLREIFLPRRCASKKSAIESRRKALAALREEIVRKRRKLIETVKDQTPIHPAWLAACINQVKSEDAVVISELGAPMPSCIWTRPPLIWAAFCRAVSASVSAPGWEPSLQRRTGK